MTHTLLPMVFLNLIFLVSFLGGTTLTAWGQEILTPKRPIPSLVEAQTIYLRTQVLIEGQQVDPQPVTEVISQQFQQVGYAVVTTSTAPHDVTVDFHCKEPTITKPLDNFSEPIFFKTSGPPCLFHYAFQGIPVDWQRIDIIVYNEGIKAAESLHQMETASQLVPRALPVSTHYLTVLDFSILLSAEWGQVPRLVTLLENPTTPLPRRRKIIDLLGEIRAEQALPCLLDLLKEPALQLNAVRALGNFGAQAQAPLIKLLQTNPDAAIQAAAAQSLGHIGATTGDTSLTPLYLEMLGTPDLDIQVKTEIVWAIGKSPDFRAHAALEALESQIWQIRSDEPELQKLREAVDWSIREVRQGGHTGAYY